MNTLYRKVLCSDRLPNCGDCYLTSVGECYLDKKNYWICNLDGIIPEWWFEEITIPADEEIEKKAESFANKKWDKYCDGNNISFSEKEQDICDKIIGISHTEYDYKNGFKEALKLLTEGK